MIDSLETAPSSKNKVSGLLSSMNLDIFAIELADWAKNGCGYVLQRSADGLAWSLSLVEVGKKRALGYIVPRNSLLGRPFSAVGVGGLSAVVGLGGALFGHNGLIETRSEMLAATVDETASYAGGSVLSSGVLVDSASLETIIPEGRGRDEVIVHKVAGGETLASIAQEYNVTLASIRYVNNMNNDTIRPGQELTILPVSGVLHTVKTGDTLQSIANKWKVSAQAIVEINWLDEPYVVSAGDKLVIPNAEIPEPTPTPRAIAQVQPGSKAAAGGGAVKGTGRFAFPTNGQITQYYSYYHNGIDIGTMNSRPPIVAADSGRVTFAGWWNGGGGYSVWIDHGNGYVTQYAHMSRIGVSVGQNVSRGQQIGVVGDTGLAFGYHLHFNVLLNGRTINPMSVL